MLALTLSATLAFYQGPHVPLDPPSGPERLNIAIPKGFVPVGRRRGHVVLASGKTQIIIDWAPGKLTKALAKAMADSFKLYKKNRQELGTMKIGPYAGPLLVVLVNQGKLGIDLHSPMVSGNNLLAVTYFDEHADVHKTRQAAQLLMDLASKSHYLKQ